MGHLRQCEPCQKVTTMSACPQCGAPTSPYRAPGHHTFSDSHATISHKKPLLVKLTLADMNAIAQTRHRLLCERNPDTQPSVESLERHVEALLRENDELNKKLQADRYQMLRSAMAIRDLHESTMRLHQHNSEVISELRNDNAFLRGQLANAAAVSSAAPQFAPRNFDETPLLLPTGVSATGEAADTTVSPSITLSPATIPKEPDNTLAGSAILCSPDQVLLSSETESVPALQSKVKRLKTAVAHKTAQLDGLWERVERAERCIQDLLAQLSYAQDLTEEETRNSARLSRHLASIGEPPEDIAAFMAIKEWRSMSRNTPTSSIPQSSISVLERRLNTMAKQSTNKA